MEPWERDINHYVFDRDGYQCQRCGERATEVAHRIANTKVNNKKYGIKVIAHAFNKRASCPKCNSSFNIGNRPMEVGPLVEMIRRDIHG